MARSQITVTDLARAGVTPITQTVADATNKHTFSPNDGRILLEVQSTDPLTQTVTVEAGTGMSLDSLTANNLTIVVPAGETVRAGPFKKLTFNQTSSDDVFVDPSVSTTLLLRAYRLPLV